MTAPDLEQRVTKLERQVAAIIATKVAEEKHPPPTGQPLRVDIDGPYGDPVVRRDPPRWTGGSNAGRPFSKCSPDYLEDLAGFLTWRAEREEAEPEKAKYAKYSRLDAARAHAWAARLRGQAPAVARDDVREEDLPF